MHFLWYILGAIRHLGSCNANCATDQPFVVNLVCPPFSVSMKTSLESVGGKVTTFSDEEEVTNRRLARPVRLRSWSCIRICASKDRMMTT